MTQKLRVTWPGSNRGADLGDQMEARVVLLLTGPDKPAWVRVAYQTGKHSDLDRRGVDVVVETAEHGDLHLQVKSSARRARSFRHKLRESGRAGEVGVVLCGPKDADQEVLDRAVRELGQLMASLENEERAARRREEAKR